MKRLVVYLDSNRAGILKQDDSGLLWFQYDSAWLDNPDSIPLSRSLPMRKEPFKGRHTRPFFAGILPDEGPRRQIAALLGVSERNDFAILERIGGECAGAINLLPENASHPGCGDERTRELNEQELLDVVAELPNRPLMAGEAGMRLSLAGSQSKLPIILRNVTIALPLGDTPSTHIIKPEPERFPGLVANEIFCMTLGRSLGLNVPAVIARTVGGKPCIIVQRYDRRVNSDGKVARIHQEDFCQALGFPPEQKYQQEGGPLLRDCIKLLRDWSTVPALDIRAFLDGLIFNVLIGNADAHGKNYSLVYEQGQRRFAPLYDLVCTIAWPELSKTPAMKIGKCESMETITEAHWQKMTEETGLNWRILRGRIADLSQRTLKCLGEAQVRSATNDAAAANHVAGIIEGRASLMLRSLK